MFDVGLQANTPTILFFCTGNVYAFYYKPNNVTTQSSIIVRILSMVDDSRTESYQQGESVLDLKTIIHMLSLGKLTSVTHKGICFIVTAMHYASFIRTPKVNIID
jgi:hypothetical protein